MNKTGEKLFAPRYPEAASAAKLRGLPAPHEWAEIESFARRESGRRRLCRARGLSAVGGGGARSMPSRRARPKAAPAPASAACGRRLLSRRAAIFPRQTSSSRALFRARRRCRHRDAVVRFVAVAAVQPARPNAARGRFGCPLRGRNLRRFGRLRCRRKHGMGARIVAVGARRIGSRYRIGDDKGVGKPGADQVKWALVGRHRGLPRLQRGASSVERELGALAFSLCCLERAREGD